MAAQAQRMSSRSSLMAVLNSAFDVDDDDAPVASSKPDAAGVAGAAGSSDAVVQPAIASVDSPSLSWPDAAPAPAMADMPAPGHTAAPENMLTPFETAVPAAPATPAEPVQLRPTPEVLQPSATFAAPGIDHGIDVAQADMPAHVVEDAPAWHRRACNSYQYDPELHDLEISDEEGVAALLTPAPSESYVPSDADTSDFEHGVCDHTLISGRYGKIEGHLFGGQKMGGLTMHTKFEAAATASSGYKTLERGMWVDCPGVPWTETQLVRIASGTVSASSSERSKSQKKYAALLLVPLGSFEDPVDRSKDEWYYAPLQKVQPLDGPVDVNGGPLFHRSGKRKRMFNRDRHGADVCLDAWVPQSISTLARKAGGLTARKPRKRAE